MNKHEKIKQMSVDEMAEFLCDRDYCSTHTCEECSLKINKLDDLCSCDYDKEEYKKWLLSEVEE